MFVVLFLMCSLAMPALISGAWRQDIFVTSFWVDPMVPPEQFVSEYQVAKDANFTTLLGGFGATTPTAIAAQVTACAATGLRCIVPLTPGTQDARAWGYQITDEPSALDFPALAKIVAGACAFELHVHCMSAVVAG